MKIWYKNIENKITTLWLDSTGPTLVVSYKLESNVEWTDIGSPENIGDNLYMIPFTFINTGSFIIRVEDTTLGIKVYERLVVQENITIQDISIKLDKLDLIHEWIKDTNNKVSNLLKRWIKRGF